MVTSHGSASARTKMRLLERSSQKPLTDYIEAAVRGYSKHGLILELVTPYVQGLHIMMNNEGGDSPLVEIVSPEEGAELKLAEAVCFDRESVAGKACFVVELAYLSSSASAVRSSVWEPFRRKSKLTIRHGKDL